MVTTIAVREDTVVMLKQLQRRLGTTTYDETIKALVQRTYRPVSTLRGALKHVKTQFKREELDRFA